jgi:hypothetical protein
MPKAKRRLPVRAQRGREKSAGAGGAGSFDFFDMGGNQKRMKAEGGRMKKMEGLRDEGATEISVTLVLAFGSRFLRG